MANPMSNGQLTGNRTSKSEKKPSYNIRIRGQLPDDLVNRLSELHAKTILMAWPSSEEVQDGLAISGDEKVQNVLPLAPEKKSVLNSEESQE